MKKTFSMLLALTALVSSLTIGAHATDYTFESPDRTEYYPSTSYADTYSSAYKYGGTNLIDYQIPALPYGNLSSTQLGVMEKISLSGLLQSVATGGGGNYGINGSGVVITTPTTSTTNPIVIQKPTAYTELTKSFYLSNGAVGRVSIPELNIKYYVWEGETTTSMSKGLGHFSSTSVWNGNVGICGHNRGATYIIGGIKDLDIGDTISYTTSKGTRTYAVETVTTISNSDWSYLQATSDNRITLVTCVAGDSSRRWFVQAVEKD